MALSAALLAGFGSWRVGEATLDYFKPSEKAASQAYAFTVLNQEMARANAFNGAVAFGALGGMLGLGLGLAGGLSRRSVRGAVVGASIGLILGAAAGALPSFVLMPWQWEHRNDDPSATKLLTPLLIHGGLWCALGAAAGLSFVLGQGVLKPLPLIQAAFGGLVGAACGTFLNELVGALAFPLAHTTDPFSHTPATRLLARLCIAVLAASGAVLSLGSQTSRYEQVASSTPHPT